MATDQDSGNATTTDAVHAGTSRETPHHAVGSTISQTATYRFKDTADLSQYMRGEDGDPHREEYGRYGNPTVRDVELRMAALDGADDALAFSSGMAAISTTLMALVKAGDHIALFRDCYRRSRQLIVEVLSRFGVEHTLVEPGDLDGLKAALRPNTKVVMTESPTNPYLVCTDLEALTSVVRAHGRVRIVVDATFATPINQRPLASGVDLVIHSATKYLAGHNDVLGGFVAGPRHLVSLVRDARGVHGAVLDPHAAFLIGRGLKTLGIRIEQQNRTALHVAERLAEHRAVSDVYYPLLKTHPSFSVAQRSMTGGAGVVSFIVKGGRAAAAKMVDGCELATIASSLGGVETLIEQPAFMSYFELSDEQLKARGIDPALVRLSVGIEDTDDIQRDLLHSLDAL